MNHASSLLTFFALVRFSVLIVSAGSLPSLNRGSYVIHGVDTCGQGEGYCVLSTSCTEDLEAFEGDHHCEGLKHAFVCCKAPATTKPEDTETTTAQQDNEPVKRISEDNSSKFLKFLSPFNAAKKTSSMISKFSARTPSLSNSPNDKSLLSIILMG